MKSSKLPTLLALVILLIPVVYLAFIYSWLPHTVAIHFGTDGKPDGYGSKSTLIFSTLFLSVLGFTLYLLMVNIHKIDPRKTAAANLESMRKIGFAVAVLLSSINLLVNLSALNERFSGVRILFPILSLFFAYLGYVMYGIKPNYFYGIRTPWALENEDNWKHTHRFAGKLWCIVGLGVALITFFTPFMMSLILFIVSTVLITVIPFVFSYKKFSNKIPGTE